MSKVAVFQSQQQQCVDEHEESGGGAHGGIAADLWLPETQQSFFVAKVELDLFCGDERYVALTLIGDLAKRNFAEKHHII